MADDSTFSVLVGAAVLFAALVAAVTVYRMTRPSKDWTTELSSTKTTVSSNEKLKDIWKRRTGTVSSRTPKPSKASGDKPFGSSYYYAHNDPDAKGGYKDGLRMEDYTMNGPRLLSKGGMPVAESSANEEETIADTSSSAEVDPTSSVPPKRKVGAQMSTAKRISRFLWDDPGDSTGIATIRIDTLPGQTTGETIAWKDANICEISIELVDNKQGLLVKLEGKDGIPYRLHIPKLYGQVEEVRKVAKSNRLLIKVQKKKNRLNKKNLAAWPHP